MTRFAGSLITLVGAALCVAFVADAGTVCEYSNRTGLRQYVSRAEYKQWMSEGKIRIDRTPINVEMPADTGLWKRLIIRPDLDVSWQIDDENKTYVETPIEEATAVQWVFEFEEYETKAVETLADVDTRRYIFWTGGEHRETAIHIVDAWMAEENPGVLDLESLYPVLRRDLTAVAEEGAEEMIYAIAHSFLSGEQMPMRLIIGLASRGMTRERLEKRVQETSAYGALPISKMLEFELFGITEMEIPDEEFDLPEGYRKISP
jgi:hypothetical protein